MVLVDVSSTVASFAGSTVTLRRQSTPTIDASGYASTPTTADTSIMAVLQRPSPDALQRLPEGLRARARWLMHSTDEVRGGSEVDGTKPDLVIHDGVTYTVAELTGQTEHGSYYRVILLTGGG